MNAGMTLKDWMSAHHGAVKPVSERHHISHEDRFLLILLVLGVLLAIALLVVYSSMSNGVPAKWMRPMPEIGYPFAV